MKRLDPFFEFLGEFGASNPTLMVVDKRQLLTTGGGTQKTPGVATWLMEDTMALTEASVTD